MSRMTSAPAPVGDPPDLLDEVLLPVVDHVRRAQLAQPVVLGRPGGGQHGRAEGRPELDGERADAAAAAVHQQRLARAEPGHLDHVRPDRAGHLGQRRGVDQVDAGRHRQQLPGRHGDPLGVPAAGQQRADLLPDRPPGRPPAPTALITPEHSNPGYADAPGGGG